MRDDRLGVGCFSLDFGGCFSLVVGLVGVWSIVGWAFCLATCARVLSAGGCFGRNTGVGGGLARLLVLRRGVLGWIVFLEFDG